MGIEAKGSLAAVVVSLKVVLKEMHPISIGCFHRFEATINH